MRLSSFVWLLALLSYVTVISAKSEFRYSYLPQNIYTNQLFGVTIISSTSSKSNPRFEFDKSSNTQPIFATPIIVRNGDDRFYTFYFKALDYDITIPELFISSKEQITSLKSTTISLKEIEQQDDFCGVIAIDMKIKTYQVSKFDETSHIVTLSIEATEANLEDINLKNIEILRAKESNIESIKRKDAKVQIEYYIVLPVAQKRLQFSYFNNIKRRFVSFDLPIEVSDTSVSTQSDLNPKDDKFERLKRYIIVFLVIFFILMFLIKRDFLYLILGVVSFITMLTFYIPHEKICIKQGSSLYILPTNTSTITTILDTKIETSLLGTHIDFKKIEYKKGVIGWIKNEDICNH